MSDPASAIGVAGLLGRPYKTIRLEWSSELRMLRVRMGVKPIQCYSLAAMAELQRVFARRGVRPFFALNEFDGEAMSRYFFEAAA